MVVSEDGWRGDWSNETEDEMGKVAGMLLLCGSKGGALAQKLIGFVASLGCICLCAPDVTSA
jgi:hypothetical protein